MFSHVHLATYRPLVRGENGSYRLCPCLRCCQIHLIGSETTFDGVSINTTLLLPATFSGCCCDVDAVHVGVLVVPAEPSLPSSVLRRFGACFDVYKTPGVDGLDVLQCRRFPLKRHARGPHVDRRVRFPVG